MPLSPRLRAMIMVFMAAPAISWGVESCDDSCQLNRTFQKLVRGEKSGVLDELQAIADRGYVPAKIALAEFYIVEESNLRKGRAILETLAERGNAKAQLHLAQSYLGRGSVESNAMGIKWLRRAADASDPVAIKMFANALRSGSWGLSQNSSEANRYESMLPNPAP